MHKTRRLVKQLLLKFGMYFSIFLSIATLLLLILTLCYKSFDALKTDYVLLPPHKSNTQLTPQIVATLLAKQLKLQNIKNYDIEDFDTDNYLIKNNTIMVPANPRSLIIKQLKNNNVLKITFTLTALSNEDSTNALKAGIFNSVIGSLLTTIICILFAIPLGIGTAIYLEEFSPKNRFANFVEVNIKNLAAIPSVVYGLLGMILFINVMNINRSSSLAGGLTLSLMSIPIIMIVTQQALKSVPKIVREGALAMGASKVQLLFQFLIPMSLPTIITGIMIAISRVIGETAPLIIIGMTAFITKPPENFFDPTTTLPTQIYLWSDNIDKLFISKSCLAILVLLLTLFLINFIALFLKSRLSQYAK